MKTKIHSLFNFISGLFAGLFIITQFSFENVGSDIKAQTAETKWHAPSVPDKIDFAGEEVPLNEWDIRERLDRELLFNY